MIDINSLMLITLVAIPVVGLVSLLTSAVWILNDRKPIQVRIEREKL